MTNNIPGFSTEDVISFDEFTIKCSDLDRILKEISVDGNFSSNFHAAISNRSVQVNRNKWSEKWGLGVDCQSLKLSDPVWRGGKLRLRLCLDFIPVEPEPAPEPEKEIPLESPLDEIRQMLDDN
jgi:hypothetical protein